jgi:hypothetical protein
MIDLLLPFTTAAWPRKEEVYKKMTKLESFARQLVIYSVSCTGMIVDSFFFLVPRMIFCVGVFIFIFSTTSNTPYIKKLNIKSISNVYIYKEQLATK